MCQTYEKTSDFLSKNFLYFIAFYDWHEKNNRKKDEVFGGKGCSCDYNVYFCDRVIMKSFIEYEDTVSFVFIFSSDIGSMYIR